MTITLTREQAQQVLDALERGRSQIMGVLVQQDQDAAIETLRARLAQPEPPCKTGSQCIGGKCPQCVVDEPEPVAWQWLNTAHFRKKLPRDAQRGAWNALYTAPPQRQWVGLTDEEIAVTSVDCAVKTPSDIYFASIIEAKLKEKNGF